jgi:hypothetical protein
MAGGELDGLVVVAGRRHRRHMQHALADVLVKDECARESAATPFAVAQQGGRRRGHDQPGRGPTAVIELLSRGRGEHHLELHLAGSHLGGRA